MPVHQPQSVSHANTEHNASGYQTRRIDHAYTQAGAIVSSNDQTAGATSIAKCVTNQRHAVDSTINRVLVVTTVPIR
jgi:hypothetical protein